MKISQSKFDKACRNPSYSHTDLACESPANAKNASGAYFRDYAVGAYKASELRVCTPEAEEACGRPMGRYATLYCPDMASPETLYRDSLSDAVSRLITDFIGEESFDIGAATTVLIAGLGNRFITPDSIGPRCADKVLATAHLNRADRAFASLGIPSVSVITPGVSSQTGIEAAEIIKAAGDAAKADFIIAIDALAAKSTERLCTTVQISNSGIQPGSGIGNHRAAITKETMGIPVIAVGVPTVISSATLVFDSLEKAGVEDLTDDMRRVLDASRGFFVSHGESDTICECAADILAAAIGKIFTDEIFG